MIVNSIGTPYYYNYNNYSRDKQVNFQGQLLLKPEKVATKRNFVFLSIGCLLSSYLLKVLEPSSEMTPILDTIVNLSNLGAWTIKEKPTQLDKKIEFKKADTIEEAKLYATEKLGIKKYKIDDLEYANWINEGLTNISNHFEGKVYFPSKIEFKKVKNAYASYRYGTDSLMINKEIIEEKANFLKCYLKSLTYKELTAIDLGKGYEEFCSNLKKAYTNIKSLSLFEKFSIAHTITKQAQVLEQLDAEDFKNFEPDEKNQFGCVYLNEFNTIYHEIGHCFSRKSNSFFNAFLNSLKYNSKISKLKIPNYDKSKIEEYIACTFAGYMQGEEYPEENTQIFDKASGIKFKK